MAKRSTKEVENDYKRIRGIVDTTFVTSIKEIAKLTNLSPAEVKTSLAKHPRVEKKIMEKLEENRKMSREKKKAEDKVGAKQESETEPKEEAKEIVIDASIAGIKGIEDILSEACKSNTKITLTSITIIELDKLQKERDETAKSARRILARASEEKNNFQEVLIDETIGIPDDCIIKYCSDNKEKTILFTADKVMCLKARMHGVQTEYFKRETSTKSSTPKQKFSDRLTNAIQQAESSATDAIGQKTIDKRVSLFDAKKVENKLIINANNDAQSRKSICVISDGKPHIYGECSLKIGDDVFIASKKPTYIAFAHYRVKSLDEEDNCQLLYSRRISDKDKIFQLRDLRYRKFLRDFYNVHNL